MCGLPCAGKTTRAKELEEERRALRLTPDEWIWRAHGNSPVAARDGAIRMAIEGSMVDLALRVLSLGTNVMLDFGLWSRAERDELRAQAEGVGARSELHFLDAPLDVLLARVVLRNADLPAGTFAIDGGELRLWSTWFEAPGAYELVPREAPVPPAT